MSHYTRSGRAADALRNIRITPDFLPHTDGSCLIEAGNTKVICTASIDENLPPFLRGKGQGWVTAEYGMLPASTASRMRREAAAGKQSGRTQEIQRLIGRSLRAVVDLAQLGERQILIDCDVIQADGGTRTAAITGAFVALQMAVNKLVAAGMLLHNPIPRSRGGRVCRRGGWRAAVGFGLSRRFGLRQRCEYGAHGFGQHHRNSGHSRGRALQPARIECLDAAGPKRRG